MKKPPMASRNESASASIRRASNALALEKGVEDLHVQECGRRLLDVWNEEAVGAHAVVLHHEEIRGLPSVGQFRRGAEDGVDTLRDTGGVVGGGAVATIATIGAIAVVSTKLNVAERMSANRLRSASTNGGV